MDLSAVSSPLVLSVIELADYHSHHSIENDSRNICSLTNTDCRARSSLKSYHIFRLFSAKTTELDQAKRRPSLVSRGRAQPATAKFIEAAAAPVPHSSTSMPALCITDDSSEPSRRSSDSRLPHQRKTGGAACFEERLLRDHLQGVQRAAFTTSRNQPDSPSG